MKRKVWKSYGQREKKNQVKERNYKWRKWIN